ncbi:peptidoglycan DD-metalloendopeptidase family protein [Legionella sp. CNM-4043-24]|uniref:peptidoglycan DD-metalloendopeptidase family protein n=1 Tax=Legionella sp. CNM-4043-24 TaxID=3421646 RepID=UPI00403B121E
MDLPTNVSLGNSRKPSKLLALIALVVAFALPFLLVKTFPHKQISYVTSIPQSLQDSQDTQDADESNSLLPPEDENGDDGDEESPAEETRVEPVKPVAKPAEPVAKTAEKPVKAAETKPESDWKIIKTRSKDSLASVFNRVGLGPQALSAVMKDNPHNSTLSRLKPNQEIQLLIKNKSLEKMIMPYTTTQYIVFYREGNRYRSKINTRKMNSYNHFLTATVKGSLYTTAKRQNIPYKLIRQMTEIFTWDIDFSKGVRQGDHFSIVYKAFYIEDKLVNTGDILAVSYTSHGKTFQAVRHTDRSGRTDYYSPQGNSLKKAFIRYPLRFSHISSTFSLSRYHPILHYRRMHKGIDLAARIGTPIQATGDGRIEIIGRQNAYGNMIKIAHNKKYSTIYGHMLKFQKGLSKGDYVKRGQIIGYVGQTGLASGPHCHYEFHINGSPKNPATIDLPRGDPLYGRELASFKANTQTLLAQLHLYEQGRLASANKPPHRA